MWLIVDNLISLFGYELWLELLLLNWVVVKNWIVIVVENLLFWKMVLKQFIKLIQLSQNKCIRCVRAPGHALDHFWWMGDLTLRFLSENGEDPRPKHTKMRVYGALLLSKGAHSKRANARRYNSSARRPGQDNGNIVPCLGAWRQSCRGLMRSFWSVLLLFSLTFLLKHNWLCWNLNFPNGLKLEVTPFLVFGNFGKWSFVNMKDYKLGLQFIWA